MNKIDKVWITECPRDAMQGIDEFIPTDIKIKYLNELLKVGFHRLDFGSFVSPKAIPQLKDTAEVLESLDLSNVETKLLSIVANVRGAEEAAKHQKIGFIGFPFSISETFQQKNTNSGIEESFETVKKINEIAGKSGQKLLIYISMAFGNPYNDNWNADVVLDWIHKIRGEGVNHFALADTVGIATPEVIESLTKAVITGFNDIEVGAHLHCHPGNWRDKTEAAYNAGCRYFDSAIKGLGGCPMAEDELVGNLATENLIQYLNEKFVETQINLNQFNVALNASSEVFHAYN